MKWDCNYFFFVLNQFIHQLMVNRLVELVLHNKKHKNQFTITPDREKFNVLTAEMLELDHGSYMYLKNGNGLSKYCRLIFCLFD